MSGATTPRAETIQVLRYLSGQQGLTDYQLNRHIMATHGPLAVVEVRRELAELGLAETGTDESGGQRWRISAEGKRVLQAATRPPKRRWWPWS